MTHFKGRKSTQSYYPVDGGEGDDAGLGAAVVGLGDGVELLLTRRVPQHQANILAAYPKNMDFKFNIFYNITLFYFKTTLLSKYQNSLVFNDQPQDPKNVAIFYRWSLFRDSFYVIKVVIWSEIFWSL